MIKWHECTADNAEFTNSFDKGVREVRKVLGSYDHMANRIFAATGNSHAGVSVRRWLSDRTLPVTIGTTLIDLALEEDPTADVSLFDFFPYLKAYSGEDSDYLN
jgi:hypothetical protein